jgi:TolA-binding protein
LTTLWEQKNKLSVKLQAETLFWMAEGFQYQKKMDQALTAYLRVAYAYPGQNIWAVTAMYRAALIYEQNKQFVPAGNLLQEVIKRADRESQKEAAQDRLDGIRARSGQQESSTIAPEFLF